MIFMALLGLLAVTSAFQSFALRRHSASSLQMNAFGTQKLGNSILDKHIPITKPKEEATEPTLFDRVPVGSGKDERKKVLHTKDQENYNEQKYETLSKIDQNLQQKKLMMNLSSGNMGTPEKLKRIELAASQQNLLPSSLSSTAVRPPNMFAAGLLDDDWEF